MQSLNKALTSMTSSKIKSLGTRECEKCGSQVPIYEANGTKVSICLTCENKQLEEDVKRFKNEMDNKRMERLFDQYSLIPGDLKTASFETYIPSTDSQKEALEKSKWYAENFKDIAAGHHFNSILFQGDYGIGKSHLSHSIANHVKEQGFSVVFIDSPSLLRMIRESYSSHNVSELEIHKVCADVDLLVLDDIGAEYVKQTDGKESWAVDVLFQIVTARMDKPTIFTTNYGSRELKDKYGTHGGRIVSRMMKGTKVIKMDGKDYRTQGW